ncbi:DMT family transporter [Pseudomonas sichuanensis]|uniref:EamA family transporter n=1 Tax=Pseudomonas TaxID=286 RepID=UPI00244B1FD2|nr:MULTISPECIES: DMT family transporter [Pseudomonas]MDH0732910.1 DMT family transporter [Pseudomonas sichuanensis]MDH1581960.1 DMT family transporter [Pseudomonas sichuanensis]MDH1591362.1 DMT family transporter [Pseudomonas sichuanensis]MDH1597002.1 DMT family transporter [Pseudomonas sichuanensis]MDU9403354.1 DMT family transporter [Pseudomonas sp. zfem004]
MAVAFATPHLFPRKLAVALLALLACCFAGNHIAARIAFDNDTGVLLAILCRSGLTLLALGGLLLWQRQPLGLPAGAWRWQLLLGLLIATQSLCLYSAVARIPVALALLVGNTFPILLALLTWALGGPRPTRRTAVLMGLILFGLVLALDVPSRLNGSAEATPDWTLGVSLAFCAACVFACALWITDHKLAGVRGPVRSMLTLLIVFASMLLAGAGGLMPAGLALPGSSGGWLALASLVVLYGTAFTLLFVCMPRLNMAQNAPVMNIEPIATLLLGWALLGQLLNTLQLLGAAVVVCGIVLLTYRKAG